MRKIKTEIYTIVILWAMMIHSIMTNPYIGPQFIIGIVGLLITTLSFNFFFRFSSYLLLILLVFSIFNLITFSSTTIITRIIDIPINIPYLTLFLILFYKRKNHLNNWISKGSEEKEKNNKIDFFKVQFKNLSDEKLEKKLNDEKITNDAKTAITELIKERNEK